MIKSQKGASLYTMGIIIVVVLFFAKFGVEIVPKYLTHLEYKKHIESTLSKFEPNATISKRQFYDAFKKTVITSSWKRDIKADATLVRKSNHYEVILKYTNKSNLVKNIDVSISFNETFTTE